MRSWKPYAGKQRVMTFSPDGSILATSGGTSMHIWLWHPSTGELKAKHNLGHRGMEAVEFSPDGQYLAAPSIHSHIVTWPVDASEPEQFRALSAGSCNAKMLAFSPADGRLVGASPSGLVCWHDVRNADPMRGPDITTIRGPGGPPVRSIRFTPDGARLLVGAADLEIWPPDLGAAVGFVRTNKRNGVRAIAVTQDGERAAVVIRNTVRVCSLAELKFERTLHWGSDMVYTTAFTPDGRTVLTAGADGSVRFWDVATGTETRRFDWGIGKVSVAAFAPDGLTCAAGGENGEIVVWDVDA